MKTYNVVTKTGRALNMEPKTNLERAKWDTEVDAGLFGQTCHLVDVETGKIVFTAYPDEGHAFGEKEEESK